MGGDCGRCFGVFMLVDHRQNTTRCQRMGWYCHAMMTLGNIRENGARSQSPAGHCGAITKRCWNREVHMVQMDWFFRHKRFLVVCLCVLVALLLVVRLASFFGS